MRHTILAGAAILAIGPMMLYMPAIAAAADWPTYLHDPSRNSDNAGDTAISASNASTLQPLWTFKTGGVIASSATVVGGTAYVGSWDGYEYAIDASTGQQKWRTFLGTSYNSRCTNEPTVGVTSTATVVNGVLYVGGGDSYWYALDPATGSVLWKVFVGDSSASGGHYEWSSPLIYNGSAYVGVASHCDVPLVQGQLLKIDLSSHAVVATFDTEPNGSVGAGIWGSPSVDPSSNTVYFTTGNDNGTSPYAEAMVAVDAGTLAVKGSWQIPAAQSFNDADWGTTPLVASLSNGSRTVSAIAKNGILYAFSANDLSKPIWQDALAQGGDCPECGQGSISSGAFDGTSLYYAGGITTIYGASYAGSVSSIDPATGAVKWRTGFSGTPFTALAYANGLIAVAPGSMFKVLDASSGSVLYSAALDSTAYGAPSIANGTIFVGTIDGTLYAFGLPGSGSGSGSGSTGGSSQGTKLGGIDLGSYCASLGQGGASLGSAGWTCGGGASIDMTKACDWQYGSANAVASEDIAGDQYSWSCYSGAAGSTGTGGSGSGGASGGGSGSVGTSLGGMDLGSYCASLGQGGAVTTNGTWSCSGGGAIDLSAACSWQYTVSGATASESIAGDPYSWSCYAPASAPQTHLLGGLNLTGYCTSLGGSDASVDGSAWQCVPSGASIDMTKACIWQYPSSSNVSSSETWPNDPYSWQCYGS